MSKNDEVVQQKALRLLEAKMERCVPLWRNGDCVFLGSQDRVPGHKVIITRRDAVDMELSVLIGNGKIGIVHDVEPIFHEVMAVTGKSYDARIRQLLFGERFFDSRGGLNAAVVHRFQDRSLRSSLDVGVKRVFDRVPV